MPVPIKCLSCPIYDMDQYEANARNRFRPGPKGLTLHPASFGSKADVDPVHFLIGSAICLGRPTYHAQRTRKYYNIRPILPLGKYENAVRIVPVKGFWSDQAYTTRRHRYFSEKINLNALTASTTLIASRTRMLLPRVVLVAVHRQPPKTALADRWRLRTYSVRHVRSQAQASSMATWNIPQPANTPRIELIHAEFRSLIPSIGCKYKQYRA